MKEYQVIKRSSEIKPMGYDGGNYKHFIKELDSVDGGKGEIIRAFATAEEAEKFAAEEVKKLSTPYLVSVYPRGKVWIIKWLDIELHVVDVDDDEFLDYYAGGLINYEFIVQPDGSGVDPVNFESEADDDILQDICDDKWRYSNWQERYDEYRIRHKAEFGKEFYVQEITYAG